jgi:hypothetical protein
MIRDRSMVGYAAVNRMIKVRALVPEPVFHLAGCERCEARLTAALRGAAGVEAAMTDGELGRVSWGCVGSTWWRGSRPRSGSGPEGAQSRATT